MLDNELSKEIKALLDEVPESDHDKPEYIQGLYTLMCAYESEKDSRCVDIAHELIDKSLSVEVPNKFLRTCYDVRARAGDFEAYCIALEWNRPIDKQFYLPRARVFKKHGVMKAFQDLADDLLDLLILNMPPRVGKSTLSMFFLTFLSGMHPERSILGSGHSTALTQSFYREYINIITSDEYRFSEIFPSNECRLVTQNAEYTYVDLGQDKRFHTAMFKSISGGTTGLAEASNLLYCDDLIVDAEEANNKDRLDKLFEAYTSTLKDRKVQRMAKDGSYRTCPELHVCTNWSIYDVTTRILKDMEEHGDSERLRVIKIPCWDENHESNFMYDYGKGFGVDYYEEMERVEDPVIFSAKYLAKPIEREGRPFERNALTYYSDLPEGKPDRIVAYNDVSHGGEDFMAMPIGCVYGRDVYITDVLFINKFDGDTYSRPHVCLKLMNNKVSRVGFERNNGGDFYSSLISQDLRKLGYHCAITTHNAPTTSSKLDRILSCQEEIKGTCNIEGSFRLLFKEPATLPRNSEYFKALQQLWGWSQATGSIQKKQHDDFPDALAGLIINILGKHFSGKLRLYDLAKAGY